MNFIKLLGGESKIRKTQIKTISQLKNSPKNALLLYPARSEDFVSIIPSYLLLQIIKNHPNPEEWDGILSEDEDSDILNSMKNITTYLNKKGFPNAQVAIGLEPIIELEDEELNIDDKEDNNAIEKYYNEIDLKLKKAGFPGLFIVSYDNSSEIRRWWNFD
jgi:hypothetical protein